MAWPSASVRTKDWGNEILTDSDLEGQFDVLHTYLNDLLDGTTGHGHSGGDGDGAKIDLTIGVQNELPVENGGTGLSGVTLGDMLYASATDVITKLPGNTTTTRKFLAQTGTGTVSAAPEIIALANTDLPAGSVVQTSNYQTGIVDSGSTTIPDDDTIPQISEGDQYLTLAFTPISATNKLKIDVVITGHCSATANLVVALFQDSTADALAAVMTAINPRATVNLTHYMTSGTTSSTTFKVRVGGDSGTFTLNGASASRKLGGVCASSITISEIAV